MTVRAPLGTGEIEILKQVAATPRHVLELRPGGHWTTPTTSIFVGGQPRWWAIAGALNQLRSLGFFRFRVGPKTASGSSFPELELTPAGREAIEQLRTEGKIPCST